MKLRQVWGIGWMYYAFVVAGWLVCIGLILGSPATSTQQVLHLTATQIKWIQFSIFVPLLLIWLVGANGVAWLRRYVALLGPAGESRAFASITDGVYLLLVERVAQSIFSTVRPLLAVPAAVQANIVLGNYAQVLLPLWAFALIFRGSRLLLLHVGGEQPRQRVAWVWWALLVLTVAAYSWLTFTNPNRTVPVDPSLPATFYLSDVLIFVTIVVPYVLTWLLGVGACANLSRAARHGSGIIYRNALRLLAAGLLAVVIVSIGIQLVTVLAAQLLTLATGSILLVIYALVILMGVGYGYVALGAMRLAKIEEV